MYHSKLAAFMGAHSTVGKVPGAGGGGAPQEASSVLFCPSQEKLHTGILKGVRQFLGYPVESPC